MAKEPTTAPDISGQVTVTHLATPEGSPAVCNVMLSGKRVAYVFLDKELTLTFLPKEHTGVKLTADQARQIIAAAQKQAKEFADSADAEREELKALGVV